VPNGGASLSVPPEERTGLGHPAAGSRRGAPRPTKTAVARLSFPTTSDKDGGPVTSRGAGLVLAVLAARGAAFPDRLSGGSAVPLVCVRAAARTTRTRAFSWLPEAAKLCPRSLFCL
jgi:hypothetical protein